jgi:hypothetical protein
MSAAPNPDFVTVFIAGVILFIVIVFLWRSRTAGYTDDQLEHKTKLKKQLRANGGEVWAEVKDANGESIYVATVDGIQLAHRDPRALLDEMAVVYDSGSPTFAEYYYRDVSEGLVDLEESRARLNADCKLRIAANLRDKVRKTSDGISAEKMRREHVDEFRYPGATYDAQLRQLVDEGVVQLVGDELVYLRP